MNTKRKKRLATVDQPLFQQLIKKYYSIGGSDFPQMLIDDLQSTFWPLRERQKDYQKHKIKVQALQNIFVKIIRERNKYAQQQGYENFFLKQAFENGIPQQKLKTWLNNKGKNICNKIIKKTQLPTNIPEGFWTEFNIPNLYDLYPTQTKFAQTEVLSQVFKVLKTSQKINERISVKKHTLFYPKSKYNPKNNTAEIKIDFNNNLEDAILLAHEIGHALAYLKLLDSNIDPESKSNYWHEQQAFSAEIKYISTLPPKLQQITNERILYYHIRAIFEYLIYSFPESDFSKFYADVHNAYYCGQQQSNPFYVLDVFFIEEPCYSAIYAVLAPQSLRD